MPSNAFFLDRINLAHAHMDQGDFDYPIKILKNLKVRIHDTTLLTQINIHDEQVEKRYQEDHTALCRSSGDPYENYKKELALNEWRCQEYIKYYDNIIRNNEL